MPTDTQATNAMLWAGWIITGLVVLFLAFDGATKIIKLANVVEASEKLGVPERTIVGIGIVLLACTAIYSIPQTAVLGAILLTGYLGGATAIHVRAGSGVFPIAFSIGFGMLVWGGLALREPRLFWTILLRQ
jgi:DoxX-like family